MTTRHGSENLKRGGQPGKIHETMARIDAQNAQIDRDASSNPEAVLETLFAEAAKFTSGRLRKLNRVKGPVERTEVEMMRETRQLADRTFEILQARGASSGSEAILAELDPRLETVAAVLASCARPFEQPISA